MIKNLAKTFIRLNTLVCFNVSRPRRDPSIPTEASYIRPFSINFLNDNKGAKLYPRKVGRGPGTGNGKFAGRGMKGHKARTGGGVPVRFEGGQTPISRRLPKFGRVKRKSTREFFNTVNLDQIDYFVKKGILNTKQPITIKHLNDCGLVKKVIYGVKILGKGFQRIDYPLHLQVSDASSTVIKHLQSKGGSIKLIFRTQLKLKEHLYPEKYPLPLADPLPPAWRVKKLDRLSKTRQHQVIYKKPKWKIEQEKQQKEVVAPKEQFKYPVPRDPNPNKIHKRRPKLYRRISYKL